VRNVELLLRENVVDLGRCGDVVRVRAGFARNYLLPRKLAVAATEDNKRLMLRRRGQLDQLEAARKQELDSRAEALGTLVLTARQKADETGQLYGSVNAAAIAELARAAGFALEPQDVRLDAPIKTVGRHVVRVHVQGERYAEISLDVQAG
jgi:large subunit ribosomal protein L9